MNLKEFVNPTKRYRPCAVWSWNDSLDVTEIENRVREFRRKGFGGILIHARAGLRSEYMSDEWMRAVRRALETAREMDMECWFCDDERDASGAAGGKTTETHDINLASALVWFENAAEVDEETLGSAVAFTQKNEVGYHKLVEKPEDISGTGVYVVKQPERGNPLFNGENYPDFLDPASRESFVNSTHDKYSKLFRYDFGDNMPGIYSSGFGLPPESVFETMGMVFPWTEKLPEFYLELYGVPLLDNLHDLLNDTPEGYTARYRYRRAINELYLQSFIIPISKWCSDHNLLYAGKFVGNDSLAGQIPSGGSAGTFFEYLDIPGVYSNLNDYILKGVIQAASVSSQLGKKRTLSVVFGCEGSDLTFLDMKRISDTAVANGADFLCPGTIQYSLKGARKHDCSPALSHQSHWENLRVMADYMARISWISSVGKTVREVLVLNPCESLYGLVKTGSATKNKEAEKIENSFNSLLGKLSAGHISFDIGEERIIERWGSSHADIYELGEMEYRVLILPQALTWESSTISSLESFEGPIIIVEDKPLMVDGVPDERIGALLNKTNVMLISNPEEIVESIVSVLGRKISIEDEQGYQVENILVNHRYEAGANVLFLINTSESDCDAVVKVSALGGVIELDPLSGRAYRYNSEISGDTTIIRTHFHPYGSRTFLIDQTQTTVNIPAVTYKEEILEIAGPYAFKRLQDNTLVIDRCSLEIDGKTVLKDASPGEAKKAVWKATGISEFEGYQPWFLEKRNMRTRTNRTVLRYRFNVEDIPENANLVMESTDRYTVKINGVIIEPAQGRWHVDKRFNVLSLGKNLVEGENVIIAATDYLWDTEIENVYITGDFEIGDEAEGYPLVKIFDTLEPGTWTSQGYPFYTGTMIYKFNFEIDPSDDTRYELDLSGAKGANLQLTVNGSEVGSVPFPPYRADVTGSLKKGENTMELQVNGSLVNFLKERIINGTWEPVSYGLMSPVKLVCLKRDI